MAALPAAAQQQPPLVCLVTTIQDLSAPGSDTGAYEQTITDAVSAAAGAHGYTLVPASAGRDAAAASPSPDASPGGAQAASLAVARAVGADVAVTGSFVVENDQIFFTIQCWDVAAGKLAAGVQQTTPFNLAFFALLDESLGTLFSSVQVERNNAPRLVFTSPDEGMEVILSGDVDIGQVSGGRVSWPVTGVAPGTKIVVEKRKTGFHTDRQTVTLVTGKEIPLTRLTPLHASSVEYSETIGQLIGVGAAMRAYMIPDWLYFSIGGYPWIQPPASVALRAAFHFDEELNLGGYVIFSPGSPFRLGLASGVGLVLTFMSTPGFPVYTDAYVDLARISLELDLPRVAFFIRPEFRYALGLGTNLLGTGWLMQNGPGISIGMVVR